MSIQLKKHITKSGKDIPYLYREKSNIFYAKKRIGDRVMRMSLGTDIEATAILKLNDALKTLEEKAAGTNDKKEEQQTRLIRDYYQKMIDEKVAQEIKEKTLNRIDVIWRHNIEPYWGNLTAKEITKDEIIKFMGWHRKAKPGIQFINTFKYLGNIFRIAAECGDIIPSNVPELEVPKPEQSHHKAKKGRIIKDSEFLEIRKHLTGYYETLFDALFYMGNRKMEIGSLKSEQIKKEDGVWFLDFSWQDIKTGIERKPPIPEFLIEPFRALKNNGTYLFPSPSNPEKPITSKSIDQAWTVAKAKAEIEGRMRIHDLRHTRATNLVRANINPLVIATYLGMTIKTLQERYLKLNTKDLLVASRSVVDLLDGGKK